MVVDVRTAQHSIRRGTLGHRSTAGTVSGLSVESNATLHSARDLVHLAGDALMQRSAPKALMLRSAPQERVSKHEGFA